MHEDRIFIEGERRDLTSLSKIYQDTKFSQNYSTKTNVIFLEPHASSTLIEYINGAKDNIDRSINTCGGYVKNCLQDCNGALSRVSFRKDMIVRSSLSSLALKIIK